MIRLRAYAPFSLDHSDPTSVVLVGEEEDDMARILCATLIRLGYEVEWSEDQGPFITVGEEE